MDEHSTTASFSHLVGAIYDCALDPGRWPETLTRVRHELGFANAILGVNALPGGELLLHAVVGVESPWLERMPDHTDDVIAAWGGPAVAYSHPLDRPAVASRIDPNLWELAPSTRYLREWAAPQGLIDSLVIPLVRDATSIGTVAMGRHRDAGPIGEREVAMAQLLLPHLQRAVAVGRLLQQRPVAGEVAAVLDALRVPVLVVSADRTIRFANPAAAALLDAGTALTTAPSPGGRRLTAVTPAAARALAAAIARACAGDVALADGSLAVPLPAGRDAHAAYVLPLGRRAGRPLLDGDGGAAVFVATPHAAPGATGSMAAALFGLTAAEQRVFDAIVAGLTPAEAAASVGVAPSTARTHLLRLFEKTGTHRQADLVRLAAALASPAASPALPTPPRPAAAPPTTGSARRA